MNGSNSPNSPRAADDVGGEGYGCAKRPVLTRRQEQVVRLLAMGCTAEEIGQTLGISTRTVRSHADALRIKLGVSRQRLIPRAYRELEGVDPLTLEA